MPTISVIVPLYNTEAYLEKCLRSVMDQTYRDIEIICVDDCSPDNSASIVEDLAKSDARIRLIRHENNLGLGGARNTGIINAKGEYIASVDSDDYIDPEMLEALYAGTHQSHFDVVVCGYERVDENGHCLSRHSRGQKQFDPIPEGTNPFLISNPAFWNKLWRKTLYTENEIFFPNHIYYQDAATTPRIYSHAKNVNFIGGGYYKYLVRGDSVTNKVSDKHLLDKFREIDVVKGFFLDRGIYDTHHDALQGRIFDSFRHHWLAVEENTVVFDEKAKSYLRHLLLMREAMLYSDDRVRLLDVATMKKAFETPGFDIHRAALASAVTTETGNIRVPRPWSSEPKVMILTLHSGENEFAQCKASVQSQTYKNVTHKVFSGLGNAESHTTLYNEIMQNVGDFHLFVKLDADMVFANEGILAEIVNRFKVDPELDHFIVACDDWMTGTQILGVHAFSNRVRWRPNADGLFVDPSPQRKGKRVIVEKPSSVFFEHSFDPSPFQAFHFGVHRTLKITQPGRELSEKRSEAMSTQWDVLYHVWCRFRDDRDLRHGLALIGADLVINGGLSEGASDYRSEELAAAFEEVGRLTYEEIFEKLSSNWETKEAREAYFEKAAGLIGLRRLQEDRVERKRKAKRLKEADPVSKITNKHIKGGIPYKLFSFFVGPFLGTNDRQKLTNNPAKLFRDAKHPVVKIGKWAHRRYL